MNTKTTQHNAIDDFPLRDTIFETKHGAQEIHPSQHLDVLSSPNHKGKYFYFLPDDNVGTPYVGIDKTKGEYEQNAFSSRIDLGAWLDGKREDASVNGNGAISTYALDLNCRKCGKGFQVDSSNLRGEMPDCPACSDNTTVSIEDVLPPLPTNGHAAPQHPGSEQTLFEATPGPLFDENDPMAILQQANQPEALMQGTVTQFEEAVENGRPISLGGLATAIKEEAKPQADDDKPYSDWTDEQLRATVMATKAEFFPAYREAAKLEAELKAKQQAFDDANADLIAAKKAAVRTRDLFAAKLKDVAAAYGTRTGDREFDKYISFREKTVIEWDEPTILGWAAENYPEALIEPAVVIDTKRFEAYVRDRLKKKLELPPSVVVSKPLETLISSKIPLGEGGAA